MKIAFAVACTMAIGTAAVSAQQGRATEAQIKAAYLYSFGKFVEWPEAAPASATASFPICVLGRDPFGTTLDDVLRNASVGGRSVAARRISAIDEVPGCRIVYIGSSEVARLDAILGSLTRSAVLTVSDIPDFTERGGMIRFVEDAKRVRFEINLPPAHAAGLVLRSDLLRVATAVRK